MARLYKVQGYTTVWVDFYFEDDGETDELDQAFDLIEDSITVIGNDADVEIGEFEIDSLEEVKK